ncbi:MAG: GNAT family N-acetyltransferase [Pseudomonadota bacterium]
MSGPDAVSGAARAALGPADVVEARLPDELLAIAALNNNAVPEVNALEPQELADLIAKGRLRVVRGRPVAGLVLTLPSGITYASLNYRWFSNRFDRFLYVDRVVVDAAARGLGVGRLLYGETIAYAKAAGYPRVCSEVNLDPPNPGSIAFHDKLGFRRIHERVNEEHGKTVAMMEHAFSRAA